MTQDARVFDDLLMICARFGCAVGLRDTPEDEDTLGAVTKERLRCQAEDIAHSTRRFVS
jgi:hypothetical protein